MHFFPDDPPDAIARKALRVNLSDLAAKGAKPAGFLLTLALPKGFGDDWLEGLRARARRGRRRHYDCPLLGGDTVYTPGPVTISIAAFGTLPQGTMVQRSGARAGDHVIVTGTIGDAALGLALRKERGAAKRWKLDAAMQRHLLARYLVPAAAQRAGRGRCAAMPPPPWTCPTGSPAISASCAAPPASAPRSRSRACRCPRPRGRCSCADPKAIETMLTGGDDFEVVATVPPRQLEVVPHRGAPRPACRSTAIGRVTAGQGASGSSGRTDGRSASRAPHSAISERAGRAIIAATREH